MKDESLARNLSIHYLQLRDDKNDRDDLEVRE